MDRIEELKAKSAPVEQQTKSLTSYCGYCDDGVAHLQYESQEYGKHKFCMACEQGKSMFEEWKMQEPQQQRWKESKMKVVESMLKKSGVGARFRDKGLKDLKDSAKLYVICESYVKNWESVSKRGYGLYLWGNVGSGKTHTATAICNGLIELYCTKIMFVNLGEVADRVKKTFEKGDGKKEDADLFEVMKSCELLVIDDIGVEKYSERVSEQMFLVINHRYENMKPIIVTSNQSLEDLEKMHRPQICSRIREMCKIVQFSGEDRRKTLRPSF